MSAETHSSSSPLILTATVSSWQSQTGNRFCFPGLSCFLAGGVEFIRFRLVDILQISMFSLCVDPLDKVPTDRDWKALGEHILYHCKDQLLVGPMSHLLTCREGEGFMTCTQPASRGKSRCFGFMFGELSCCPSKQLIGGARGRTLNPLLRVSNTVFWTSLGTIVRNIRNMK